MDRKTPENFPVLKSPKPQNSQFLGPENAIQNPIRGPENFPVLISKLDRKMSYNFCWGRAENFPVGWHLILPRWIPEKPLMLERKIFRCAPAKRIGRFPVCQSEAVCVCMCVRAMQYKLRHLLISWSVTSWVLCWLVVPLQSPSVFSSLAGPGRMPIVYLCSCLWVVQLC